MMLDKQSLQRQSCKYFSKRLQRKTTFELKQSEQTEPSQSQCKYESVTSFPDLQTISHKPTSGLILHPPKLHRCDQDAQLFSEGYSLMDYDWDIMSMNSRSYPSSALYATAKIFKQTQKLSNSPSLIGGRQYFTKLRILDPLGELKHLKICQKLVQSKNGIYWNLGEAEQNLLFSPNMILIPSFSFLLQIQMQSLKDQFKFNKEQLNFAIDANSVPYSEIKIRASIGEFYLEMDCEKISEERRKVQVLEQLNYKVNMQQYLQSDLVKITTLKINLNSESQNSQESGKELKNSQIVETLKTQVGSKNYQKQIKCMDQLQIQELFFQIEDSLSDLISNQYANYFIQEFFILLSRQNKIRFLTKLLPHIGNLICSPYGTFVFQAFIDHLIGYEEFELMTLGVKQNFYHLAFDQYGSHFLRKLLETMPDQLLIHFTTHIQCYFVSLCQNRQAVCVVKSYLKSILRSNSPNILSMMHNILEIVKQNISAVIRGQYSNYIVQEICQNFHGDLSSLYSQIAQNFFCFERNKYSMIILTKFLKNYWKNEPKFLQKVAQTVTEQIIESFKSSKEGMKLAQELRNCLRPEQKKVLEKKNGADHRHSRRYIRY